MAYERQETSEEDLICGIESHYFKHVMQWAGITGFGIGGSSGAITGFAVGGPIGAVVGFVGGAFGGIALGMLTGTTWVVVEKNIKNCRDDNPSDSTAQIFRELQLEYWDRIRENNRLNNLPPPSLTEIELDNLDLEQQLLNPESITLEDLQKKIEEIANTPFNRPPGYDEAQREFWESHDRLNATLARINAMPSAKPGPVILQPPLKETSVITQTETLSPTLST